MDLHTFTHSAAGRLFFQLPRSICHGAAGLYGAWQFLADRGGARSEILPLLGKALNVRGARAWSIACQAAITSARCYFDSAMLLHRPTAALQRWNPRNTFRGVEHFEKAAGAGRGVILATTNFSCFYYAMMTQLPSAMERHAFTLVRPRLAAIDPLFNRLCDKIRAVSGREYRFIETGGQRAAIDFIAALKAQGTVICMVDFLDHDTLTVPAPFFGQPSCLPGGYLMIADRTGAPIVPCHTRYEDGRFVTVFGAPIDPADAPDDERVLWLARQLNQSLENAIAPAPGQWGAWGSVKMKWELGNAIAEMN